MIRAALLFLMLATGARASDLALEASQMLLDAAGGLESAQTATDRIAALTRTVRAYETGLSAMREGLRRAALEERELSAKLADEDADLGALLVLMQTATRQATTEVVVHPEGALQTIRGGMLASMLVPALHERAAALDDDLARLGELIALQRAGYDRLEAGLAGVREARLALTRAVGERAGDLPPRVATDDAAIEALVNSSETLSAFADALAPEEVGAPSPGRGWKMPVKGEVLAGFNERDARGQRRPGWTVGTGPEALVTAPGDATVRFSGEVPSQGRVTILELDGGTLLILAGLDRSLVVRDQIVARGEPIGFMAPGNPSANEKLNGNRVESSLDRKETLYIELRQGRQPVDPAGVLVPGQE
jgi:septal ring factor EnvC (AmiA/AmiB activator)